MNQQRKDRILEKLAENRFGRTVVPLLKLSEQMPVNLPDAAGVASTPQATVPLAAQAGGYQAESVSPLANRIRQAANYLRGVDDLNTAITNRPINALGRMVHGNEGWEQFQRDNAIQQRQFKVDEDQGRGYEFGPSVNRALGALSGQTPMLSQFVRAALPARGNRPQ